MTNLFVSCKLSAPGKLPPQGSSQGPDPGGGGGPGPPIPPGGVLSTNPIEDDPIPPPEPPNINYPLNPIPVPIPTGPIGFPQTTWRGNPVNYSVPTGTWIKQSFILGWQGPNPNNVPPPGNPNTANGVIVIPGVGIDALPGLYTATVQFTYWAAGSVQGDPEYRFTVIVRFQASLVDANYSPGPINNNVGMPPVINPSIWQGIETTQGWTTQVLGTNWPFGFPTINATTGQIIGSQNIPYPVGTDFQLGFEILVTVGADTFIFESFVVNITVVSTGGLEPGDPGPGNPIATSPFAFGSAAQRTIVSNDTNIENRIAKRYFQISTKELIFNPKLTFDNYRKPEENIFIPNVGLPKNIFADKVHAGIAYTQRVNNFEAPYSDFVYGDVNRKTIEASLNSSFKEVVNKAKDINGTPLKGKILDELQRAIIFNELSRFKSTTYQKIVEDQKNIKYSLKTPTGNQQQDRAEGIKYALENAKSLDYKNSKYNVIVSENLRLWKTIATDVNKGIPIKLGDGTDSCIYALDNDTYPVVAAGGVIYLPINDGDTVDVVGLGPMNTSINITMDLCSDLDRSFMLDFQDQAQVFNLLGEEYSFHLEVEDDIANQTEETASLTTPRSPYYFLKLDNTSFTELDRQKQFIRKSSAVYNLETDTDTQTSWAELKPWPYLTLYVDNEDPIIDLLIAKEQATITFKDFTTDIVEVDSNYPIFPRRIPWHLIIIPTDNSDLLVTHTKSQIISYGKRSIDFILHPSPEKYKQRWNHQYLDSYYPYPAKGATSDKNPQAVKFRINTTKISNKLPFVKGTEVVPRREQPYRKVLALLKEYKTNFTLTNNMVTWFDILSKINPRDNKALSYEILNFQEFKSKVFRGAISGNTTVDSTFAQAREIPSPLSPSTIIPSINTPVTSYSYPAVSPTFVGDISNLSQPVILPRGA